jgi:hypothetical protein
MTNKLNIVLRTATELTQDYNGEWIGDCGELTQASSSISQDLTNREVERLWDAFASQDLVTESVVFTFFRQGRDKMIRIKKV